MCIICIFYAPAFLVDIIARRTVWVEFRLSQVHFRVPVVPLFLHQNTIIYPGKCGPFGNLGGCVRTRCTPPPPCVRACVNLMMVLIFIGNDRPQQTMNEFNPFIEHLFFWRSSQGFVKTDLYPLYQGLLIYVQDTVFSALRWSTCRPLLRACQWSNFAEERRP